MSVIKTALVIGGGVAGPAAAMAVGPRRVADQPGLSGLPPLQLVWRADLHRAPHDRAVAGGITVVHGKRLVGPKKPPPLSPPGSTPRSAH